MILQLVLYFLFVQVTLLFPGYAFVKKSRLLKGSPGAQLCLAYVFALLVYAIFATLDYAFNFDASLSRYLCWTIMAIGIFLFIKGRYYRSLWGLRFPLICLLLMNVFSLVFISLGFNAPYKLIPDPTPRSERNYSVFDVKVINVAQTRADDNYIPYRQAQFFVNRSDPSRDSLIGEWGVSFFQRTPLMGAITANYFNLLGDKPPVAYTWSSTAKDPGHTFLKFQVLAQILNGLLIVPGFFVVRKLFNKKTAAITCVFLVTSPFFLYNAFFSWPKSLVGFFVLTSLLLLFNRTPRATLLAGLVGGAAYLTHDLAVLYIGAAVIYLLISKRFRDVLLYVLPSALLALPWLLTASLKYHRPSSFIYYPFSVNGIPQTDNGSVIFRQFFDTSPLTLIGIRIKSILYLLSPYQLIVANGEDAARRIWALSLYSVSGALGIGLLLPAYIAIIKFFKKYWIAVIYILVPVILCTLIIGWRLYAVDGLGALHFAEAAVVIWSGLSIQWLIDLKRPLIILLAYILNAAQFIFFALYSYKWRPDSWFSNPSDIVLLVILASILCIGGWAVHILARKKKSPRFLGAELSS